MKFKKGFTLIELLVVMVIIGLLAGFIMPNLMSARERARDTRRKSDLEQIQKALELYKMDQSPSVYPSSLPSCDSCWSSAVDCGGTIYMKKLPCDPKPSAEYNYTYVRDPDDSLKYTLTACLENKSDPNAVTVDRCPDDVGIMRTEP